MKKTFGYVAPALESTATKLDFDAYDRSLDLFEEKRYIDSLHAILDYFDSNIRVVHDNDHPVTEAPAQSKGFSFLGFTFRKPGRTQPREYGPGRNFTVPHGSIILHIQITDTEFIVRAPYVSLPSDERRIPMMRRVCELNLSDLDLVHFTLDGNELHLNFRCPLELTHTHKIVYMLRELCLTGDKYDDEFVTKYGAKRLFTPEITPFSPEETQRIIEGIRQTCRETIEAIDEYANDRRFGIAWHFLAIALFKISYFARPQGNLDADLDRAVDDAWADGDTQVQVSEGREFLQKLLDSPDDELAESLYKVQTICSPRRASDLGNIRSNLQENYDNAVKAYSSDSMECCMRTLLMIYRTYFYNDLQDDVNHVFAKALEKSANMDFGPASNVLIKAMRIVMEKMASED